MAAWDRYNRLIGVNAETLAGSDHGSDIGEQVGTPFGPEPSRHLPAGGGGQRFPLAAIVVGRGIGVFEEGEQLIAHLAVSLSQSLLPWKSIG